MKKIMLKELRVRDFQSIKELTVNFGAKATSIEGTNGLGKSTVLDALLWVITGKNQQNQSDTNFKILPLDKENTIVSESKPEVSLVVNIDGEDHEFTRMVKVSYKKDEEGNVLKTIAPKKTTEFVVDEVVMKKSDYENLIKEHFGTEEDFKLLTNVNHFLNNLKEKDQRDLLLNYINEVTFEQMCNIDSKFEELKELASVSLEKAVASNAKVLNDTKHRYEDYKSELKGMQASLATISTNDKPQEELIAERDKAKEELKELKHRRNQAIETSGYRTRLEIEIERLEDNIKNFDNKFKQELKDEELRHDRKVQEEKQNLERLKKRREKLIDEYNNIKTRLGEIEKVVAQEVDKQIERNIGFEKDDLARAIKRKENALEELQEKIKAIYNSEKVCHACGQEIEIDKEHQEKEVSEIEENIKFIQQEIKDEKVKHEKDIENIKQSREKLIERDVRERSNYVKSELEANINTGKQTRAEIERTEKHIDELINERKELSSREIDDSELAKMRTSLEDKKAKLKEVSVETVDVGEIEALEETIETLNSELSSFDNINKIKDRIADMEARIKETKVKISDKEYKKSLFDEYLQLKNAMLSRQLKEYFNSDITFKFLEFTQDGTPKDVFKLLVNGVDYQNVNTANKIIAGFEMCKFFQDKKETVLPVLIDNVESIIVELPKHKGQLVTARATKNKSLKIERIDE